MANTKAIQEAYDALDKPYYDTPKQFLQAVDQRIAAVIRAVIELRDEFSEYRRRTTEEIDDLKDQIADLRGDKPA